MEIFFTILILITVVAMTDVLRRIIPFKIPLPLFQIFVGAAISIPSFGLHVKFDPELFMLLFIPPLLFADGRRMPIYEFMQAKREIIGLALFLVIVTVLGLGLTIPHIIKEMPMPVAFALAAVLSPTDAVALSGIVGKGRLPHVMNQILEGEALLNDASALVSLRYAVGIIMGTLVFTEAEDFLKMGGSFVLVSLGGIAIGIIVSRIYVRLVRLMMQLKGGDESSTQMIALLLIPFLVYGIAEHLGTSGILAAVAAGMTINYSNAMNTASLTIRLRANSIWEFLEFILNGTVFVMLGLQIPTIIEYSVEKVNGDDSISLLQLVSDIFIIYFLLMLVRFLWLLAMKYQSKLFLKKKPYKFEKLSTKELLVMTFAGVRGAVTLAAALSIPHYISTNPTYVAVPARYQVTFLAIGVILVSLIVAVIILPLLLRGYTVDRSVYDAEKKIAYAAMQESALASLQVLEERIVSNSDIKVDPQRITEIHNNVANMVRHALGEKDVEAEYYDSLELRFRLASLRAQRGELMRLKATRKISEETANKLRYDLDLKENALVGGSERDS